MKKNCITLTQGGKLFVKVTTSLIKTDLRMAW